MKNTSVMITEFGIVDTVMVICNINLTIFVLIATGRLIGDKLDNTKT